MKIAADIDIDLANRDQLLQLINHTAASQRKNDQLVKHNSGIYVTDIPRDSLNGHASIDYQQAEQRGYFKIDLLNNTVYQLIRDQQHYDQMLMATPPWERLCEDVEWSKQLVHVGNHTDLLISMRPDSIPRLAAFISVIRPGKAHLQNKPWSEVFESVWDGDSSKGFIFKKSHAISYSMLVALHMNLVHTLDQGN
jgi:hypothetical protein